MNNPNEKTYRAGTYTAGLSLIFGGMVLLVSLFQKTAAVNILIKCAPVILILLGVEIILTHLFYKGAKLKYDFLSGFLCLLLVLGSLGLSSLNWLMAYDGPDHHAAEARSEKVLYEQCYAYLKDVPYINRMEVSAYHYGQKIEDPQNPPEPTSAKLRIRLDESVRTPAEFAAAGRSVTDTLLAAGMEFESIRFSNDAMSLDLEGKFLQSKPADQLTALVEMERTREAS